MNITMKTKMVYEAPEMESVKLRTETGIMTYSGEGKGTASANAMMNDSSTFGDEW